MCFCLVHTSTYLCTSTLTKWWCLEGRETPAHSASSTALARSVVLPTGNTLNCCVDCSTNTWASLLKGTKDTLTSRFLIIWWMKVTWLQKQSPPPSGCQCLLSLTYFSFSLVYFRMYINFMDMEAANVAWNSTTFGWNGGQKKRSFQNFPTGTYNWLNDELKTIGHPLVEILTTLKALIQTL